MLAIFLAAGAFKKYDCLEQVLAVRPPADQKYWVLEWADHHKDDPVEEKEDDSRNKKSTDIDDWDQKFMQVDQEMLFEIILVICSFFLDFTDAL